MNQFYVGKDAGSLGINTFNYILSFLPRNSVILELGSGEATDVLSKYYTLFSVEHSKEWLNKYNSTYFYVPLTNNFWYEDSKLRKILKAIKFDMFLIDGPPAHTRERAGCRNNILKYIDYYKDTDLIIIDDTHRPAERKLAEELAYKLNRKIKCIEERSKTSIILQKCIKKLSTDINVQYITIYTAIFGGYDLQLPNLTVTPNLNYKAICFTDSDINNAPPYWKIIKVPKYFRDNKINSLFFKCLAHIIFPESRLVIWIDGNLYNVKITYDWVKNLLSNKTIIATPRHIQRNSISEEADICISQNLDDPIKIESHLNNLSIYNLHETKNLSATGFLFRDLSDWRVHAANVTWFNYIVNGSRRDQLSFNAALQFHGLISTDLNVNWWENNSLFSKRVHTSPKNRKIETQQPFSDNLFDSSLFFNQSPIYISENWSKTTLKLLLDLNGRLKKNAKILNLKSYCYMGNFMELIYIMPDPRLNYKREFLRRSIVGSKNILQIGFNAGCSSIIILDVSKSSILTSMGFTSKYSYICANFIKKYYSNRFIFSPENPANILYSKEFIPDESIYDLVHINNEPNVDNFKIYMTWFLEKVKIGTLLLVDSTYVSYIHSVLLQLQKIKSLVEISPNIISDGELRLFRKTKTINIIWNTKV